MYDKHFCRLGQFGAINSWLAGLFFSSLFFLSGCLSTADSQSVSATSAFENDLNVLSVVADKPVSVPADSVALLTFYSHEFGEYFPHAFVELTTDLTKPNVDQDAFGFTAKNISPAILMGSVNGEVRSPKPDLIRNSNSHFTVAITSAQLEKIKSIRAIWSSGAGSRYSLNKRNCVHFVGEIADVIGLSVNFDSKNFKRPKRFLEEVAALNPTLNLNENIALASTEHSEIPDIKLITAD